MIVAFHSRLWSSEHLSDDRQSINHSYIITRSLLSNHCFIRSLADRCRSNHTIIISYHHYTIMLVVSSPDVSHGHHCMIISSFQPFISDGSWLTAAFIAIWSCASVIISSLDYHDCSISSPIVIMTAAMIGISYSDNRYLVTRSLATVFMSSLEHYGISISSRL